jgi:hypothetical protein
MSSHILARMSVVCGHRDGLKEWARGRCYWKIWHAHLESLVNLLREVKKSQPIMIEWKGFNEEDEWGWYYMGLHVFLTVPQKYSKGSSEMNSQKLGVQSCSSNFSVPKKQE